MSKTTRTVLTIVWVAIAAVLVGIMLWGIFMPNAWMNSCTGSKWSWNWGWGSSVLGDDAQRAQKIEINGGEPKAIELRFIDETVIVEQTSGDTIRVEQTSGQSILEEEMMRYGMREDTLIVESGLMGKSNMKLRPEVVVKLYLPQNVEYPVSLDTSTGRIEVNGGNYTSLMIDTGTGAVQGSAIIAKETIVDTGTGAVKLDGIASEVLKAYTSTGRIDLTAVDANELRLDTTTGAVYADGKARYVNVDTTTGEVIMKLAELVDYNADTTTGRVDLTCADRDSLAKIDIETTTGGVRLAMPESSAGFVLDFDSSTGNVINELGNSYENGAPEINVDTTTGSLEIIKL